MAAQNAIAKVRSNFVFHDPRDGEIDEAFEMVPDGAEREWYLSHVNINTFYFMSDMVIAYGMINAAGEADPMTAHIRIMDETKLVSGVIIDFALTFIDAVWIKHFEKEVEGELVANIAGAPNVFGVRLPFYAEEPDAPEPTVASAQA